MNQTATTPYRLISSFFVFILALITWGFYKTYLVFFPSFTGFTLIHHLHGAVMMAWMIMLIVQPLLIRYGRVSIHRAIGKLSYVIAPLVVLSIFLTAQLGYYRVEPNVTHTDKIAGLALPIPALLAFAILYILAIYNRRHTYDHLRYMIGTALLMIGPGLGRALITNFNVPFPLAVTTILIIEVVLALAFFLVDVFGKRRFVPFLIVLMVNLTALLAWEFKTGQVWQSFGNLFASLFF
jgi:hypothetical protein